MMHYSQFLNFVNTLFGKLPPWKCRSIEVLLFVGYLNIEFGRGFQILDGFAQTWGDLDWVGSIWVDLDRFGLIWIDLE